MPKRAIALIAVLISIISAACTPQAPASIVELNSQASTPTLAATPRVIYVTPTPEPSAIPTIALMTAQPTATLTLPPSPTPDGNTQQATCRARLEALYTSASELCLGKPDGFFCNGGLPPQTQPQGPVSSALAVQGAVVEAQAVESVQTAPLPSQESGGLMWLRLYDDVDMKAVLLGDVHIRNATSPDLNFPDWQNIVVQTTDHATLCNNTPHSTFVVQSEYGESAQMVINGVSVQLRGTVAVQTPDETRTSFIALEGSAQLTVLGVPRALVAGQQLDVPYVESNYTRPSALPAETESLVWERIDNLPVVLFDRAMLLPQPGYAQTLGNVNMRAEPSLRGDLLYQVPPDETMSILGTNATRDWYHIRLGNGETGWMKADLLGGQVGQVQQVYAATPQPPQRYGNLGTAAVVTADSGGNLREAPDVYFPVIDTIAQGTELELLARSPYSPWVKVDINGTVGWLALITIETQSVVGFLPVDYDAPLPPRPTAIPNLNFGGGHAYPDPNGGQ